MYCDSAQCSAWFTCLSLQARGNERLQKENDLLAAFLHRTDHHSVQPESIALPKAGPAFLVLETETTKASKQVQHSDSLKVLKQKPRLSVVA